MTLGPIRRRSADVDLFENVVQDVELGTEEISNWLDTDTTFSNTLAKLAQDTFSKTNHMGSVTNTLIAYLQKALVDGALKLSAPYQGLALIALEDVGWDALVQPFSSAAWYGGPEFYGEEDEEAEQFDSLDKALNMLPTEAPDQPTSAWSF